MSKELLMELLSQELQEAYAVPYKYKAGEVPKGTWAVTPSVKFGTNVQFTQKPMGTETRVTNAEGKRHW